MHHGTVYHEVQQLVAALHLHVDGGAGFAAHDVDGVLQGGGDHVDILHTGEDVTFAQARVQRGAVQEYAADGAQPRGIITHDLDADARILALVISPELSVLIGRVVVGVGIAQSIEQTHLRAVKHGLRIRLLIVILLHNLPDLIQLGIALKALVLRPADGHGIVHAGGKVADGGGQQRAAREQQQNHQRQAHELKAFLGKGFQ